MLGMDRDKLTNLYGNRIGNKEIVQSTKWIVVYNINNSQDERSDTIIKQLRFRREKIKHKTCQKSNLRE